MCLCLYISLMSPPQIVEHVQAGRCSLDADVVVLGQQVQCLIAFSKGFSSLASPEARSLWKQALRASFSPLPLLLPHHEQDYALKVLTLAHRMVRPSVCIFSAIVKLYAVYGAC